MEYMSVLAGEAATGHGEMAGAAVSVAGHRLVDHDAVQESGIAVALGIVRSQIAVRQLNGIQAFNTDSLRKI